MILPILTSPSYLNVLTLLSNCPNVYFALCCSTRKAIVTLIVRKWSVVTMFMMRFWQLKSSSHHSFLPQNFWSERAQSQNEFSYFPSIFQFHYYLLLLLWVLGIRICMESEISYLASVSTSYNFMILDYAVVDCYIPWSVKLKGSIFKEHISIIWVVVY